jgi:hypothetical protein
LGAGGDFFQNKGKMLQNFFEAVMRAESLAKIPPLLTESISVGVVVRK